MMEETTLYLKLGGSLITDKRAEESIRADVLQRMAGEIAAARRAKPSLSLVLGHGSGSFGHVSARKYGTRAGVADAAGWYGFGVTGDAAARLNRAVVATLLSEGVPVWSIQPGAILRCRDGVIADGSQSIVREALDRGIVPVLYGDVVLDTVRGGTIASTEEIFAWLARALPPRRIVLAGEVDGVFTADPLRHADARHVPLITPADMAALGAGLAGSHGVDVTGGMLAKVRQCVELVQEHDRLEIVICSGLVEGNLYQALVTDGSPPGTVVRR
jgi:isopentenyl phosphate kinase